MVDVVLMQALMKATADDAALLTVGDIDQLPSVGPGQVFAEIIGSGLVPVVRVTQVLRRATREPAKPQSSAWPKVRLQTCLGSAPRKARATIAPGGHPGGAVPGCGYRRRGQWTAAVR